MKYSPKIAIVIPCYKVADHILDVIEKVDPLVDQIYVVDDGCPENTGSFVKEHCKDKRVKVLANQKNMGVGGAVCTGYREALNDGNDIIVKIDGDGQMDPGLIAKFVDPLIQGKADYTKGNRFFFLSSLQDMPVIRKIGNALLSFVNKVSSGYWNIMDPTNGFTAIHSKALLLLPLSKLNRGYFFESEMLFRLNTISAVVKDIPMDSVYEDEQSNLNITRVIFRFPFLYGKCFMKRIFYNYFLRDFNIASIEIVTSIPLLLFGIFFGGYHWYVSSASGHVASTGTVMISALPIIIGFQLLLSSVNYDIVNIPKIPISTLE